MILTPEFRKEYLKLYESQTQNPSFPNFYTTLAKAVSSITSGKSRYEAVSVRTGVPWYVVGLIHLLECSSNFSQHLHNGDPLKFRTVHVPTGRPPLDHWTWEDSAVDALQLDKLTAWKDWSIAGILYKLETYNGLGYRNHNINTPYLWSGTNHYIKGKYGSDGRWDPNLVSKQLGAAPILKDMASRELIRLTK